MTADLTAAARAALSERKAKVEAAVSGTWVTGSGTSGWTIVRSVAHDHSTYIAQMESLPNAALIVQMRSDYEALLSIGLAAIERHQPDPDPIELMLHMDEECPTGECESGDGHLSVVCRGCYPSWDGMEAHTVWPCAEVKPWLDLLGVGEGE